MTCNAPNPGTEMRCTREANHSGECFSKYKAEYEHGVISFGEMTWAGPNNLEVKRESAESDVAGKFPDRDESSGCK